MGRVKPRIKASSLIEVIVASIVFMVIFLVSLETIAKVTTKSDVSIELIDAQNKIHTILQAIQTGVVPTQLEYNWGHIIITQQKYKHFDDLTLLRIEATLDRNNKKIVRYFIFQNELH